MSDISITTEHGWIYLTASFNADANTDYRALAGEWRSSSKTWMFAERDLDRVREVLKKHFGMDDRPATLVDIQLTIKDGGGFSGDDIWIFCGKQTIWRRSRDAAVSKAKNVLVLSGEFSWRGGSMKYPDIGQVKGDMVLEIRDVPANHPDITGGGYDIKIITDADTQKNDLNTERAALLERLAEIDKLLAEGN